MNSAKWQTILDNVNELINTILKDDKKLILIAWPSASWKSYIAEKVKEKLENLWKRVILISTDDYYKDNTLVYYLLYWTYDHPNLINFNLLNKHLKNLLNWKSVYKPVYSFENKMTDKWVKVDSNFDYLIVEWLYTFNFVSKNLLKNSLKIFIKVDVQELIIRRIIRDPARTKEPLDRILNSLAAVFPMRRIYGFNQIKKADIIFLSKYEIIKDKWKQIIQKQINFNIIPDLKNKILEKKRYFFIDYFYWTENVDKVKNFGIIVREKYYLKRFLWVSIIKKDLIEEDKNQKIFKEYEIFVNIPWFLKDIHNLMQVAWLGYFWYKKFFYEVFKTKDEIYVVEWRKKQKKIFIYKG